MKIRPKIRIHKCVLNSKFHGNMQTIWRKSKEKREVAVQLHLERSCYTYYELGRSNPSYRSLLGLARLYGVTVEYLIDDEIPVLPLPGHPMGRPRR